MRRWLPTLRKAMRDHDVGDAQQVVAALLHVLHRTHVEAGAGGRGYRDGLAGLTHADSRSVAESVRHVAFILAVADTTAARTADLSGDPEVDALVLRARALRSLTDLLDECLTDWGRPRSYAADPGAVDFAADPDDDPTGRLPRPVPADRVTAPRLDAGRSFGRRRGVAWPVNCGASRPRHWGRSRKL